MTPQRPARLLLLLSLLHLAGAARLRDLSVQEELPAKKHGWGRFRRWLAGRHGGAGAPATTSTTTWLPNTTVPAADACSTQSLGETIPAFRSSSLFKCGSERRYCVVKDMAVKKAIKGGLLMLANGHPGAAAIRALIWGALAASKQFLDFDELEMCTLSVTSIVASCPRGHLTPKTCPLLAQKKNPKCGAVTKAVRRGDEGRFKCAMADWWDACCSVREAHPESAKECAGCGQDGYLCSELPDV